MRARRPHFGLDLVLTNLAQQPEASRVVADVVFLKPSYFGEIDSAVDFQDAVLDGHLDVVFFHTRHLHHDVQSVMGFVDVRGRQEYPGRDGGKIAALLDRRSGDVVQFRKKM